ncbi:ABC transporter substrate-binding protein [Hathewaya limosa]|uniref:Iron complex transport system substrate-binding protein n=1 Tax=Hathewaya limosa TaxID=1536 RepID=A0ABU0JSA2_HATLI|nr:ABC transporter substrate-binding protein [Hathewaya limosa]MDQ0479977.1 iron complex transport system substrate-binding protein [Hathewaya limosa]
MRNKRLISLICSLSIVTVLMSGCGTKSSESKTEDKKQNAQVEQKQEKKSNYPVEITNYDEDGNEVKVVFKEKPKKVITTNEPPTELLLTLGLEDCMIGTSYLDNPILPELKEKYDKIPVLSEKYPSKEVVLSKQPDLLFGWSSVFMDKNLGTVKSWNERGVNTFIQRNSGIMKKATIENACKDIKDIGKIFDVEDKAEKLVKKIEDRVKEVENKTKGKEKLKVLIVEAGENNKYYAYKEKSLASDMVEKVGGINAAPKGGDLSVENILKINPDAIVLINYEMQKSDNKGSDEMKKNKALQKVNAIKNNKVIDTPLAETYAGGVRIINGLDRFAKGFYPDLIK